ncbi:MAG: DUF1565 domain-containing protein [Deltaproteobacteria bacterium]|nr:DUF1565 domain-containing protein [Deltaproteobacteria bacterium]
MRSDDLVWGEAERDRPATWAEGRWRLAAFLVSFVGAAVACGAGTPGPAPDSGSSALPGDGARFDGPPGADGTARDGGLADGRVSDGKRSDGGGPSDGAVAADAPAPAGKTYVVALAGKDSNPGTAAAPLRTIGKALALAAAGDLVLVRPGTYAERLSLDGKHGVQGRPITVLGDSRDPNTYPVIDGGDPGYATSSDKPAVSIARSSWLTFERLKIVNSSKASVSIAASGYVVLRRLVLDFHGQGVLVKDKAHHVLVEYCELFQSYGQQTWTQLKGSKWEGGAFVSFGGAGMHVVRFNHIHDAFNGIYLSKGSRTASYHDANVWIYRNRFERIVDDPYEPETYAFNNHFFHNTLVNTHRMMSLAPAYLGPIYCYANVQTLTTDVTGEAASKGRRNSAFKVELNSTFPTNGAYVFNNSIDVSTPGVNGYGVDLLAAEVHKLFHYNNAYRTEKVTISTAPRLVDAELDADISQTSLGYAEPNGLSNAEPGFLRTTPEDFRLGSAAAARGRARAIVLSVGFASSAVVAAKADVGAYQAGEQDFRVVPSPVYAVPPGGEDPSFGSGNLPWPADVYGGPRPPSGPRLK